MSILTFDRGFLRSKVARRVFILFVLCALLPIAALTVISFSHVTNQLHEQSQKRLRQASKTAGMAIYERLLFLEAELKLAASNLQTGGAEFAHQSDVKLGDELAGRFSRLHVLRPHRSGGGEVLAGSEALPALTDEQRRHVLSDKTLVLTQSREADPPRVFMGIALSQGQKDGRILLAELNGDYLWGLSEEGTLPPNMAMCVFEQLRTMLTCTVEAPADMSEQIAFRVQNSSAAYMEWQRAGEEFLASYWSIPMKYRFLTPTWTVVLSEPRSVALAALGDFTKIFPPIVLLSLLVVCLFSLIQIRRNMDPLEKLQEGTRRIARRDFDSRVELTTEDEFQELASSFNTMAERLGKQFHALATIAEIDRAVLSALEIEKIVDTVLAKMRDVFPSDVVAVTVRDIELNRIGWMYLKAGPEGEVVLESLEFTLTDLQKLIESPDHLLVTNQEIPSFLTAVAKRGAQSFMVLPLFRSEQLSGYIVLGYREEPVYSEEDLVRARQVANQVAAALANAQDLSERKRAEGLLQDSNQRLEAALTELKATQKQMVQQERLRALGQMASGIAHDFNNTLSPIIGFSELLLLNPKNLDDKDKLNDHLRIINTAARDATKVVSRLREFYRPREKEDLSASVDLNKLVEQCVRLTQPKWKDQALANGITINLETDLQAVSPVAGNESELREVLTNLVFNAVDAITATGAITLRTRLEGRHVVLEVSDTGAGMTEEVRQRCLEPFFSTKGDRGTGLGLAMVYGIIGRHQGTIDIRSEPGKGSTFQVRLPSRAGIESHSTASESGAIAAGWHVLVVDDDPIVRKVTAEYLTTVGYTVETAINGFDALEKFERGRFDLVVSDQGMPDMSGDRLAGAVKERSPGTPVILLTGAGRTEQATPEDIAGVDLILSKPLTMSVLRDALAKLGARKQSKNQEISAGRS